MNTFAKLFTHPTMGQILVTIERSLDDETVDVRYAYQPTGLGVCSLRCTRPDDESGWDAAEAHFAIVTEESAAAFVAPYFKMATNFA
ncbi:MAG: hypothetical protein LCH53_06025 [Bacteroidetes bacterium]|nr:hypothetical protein [Bacteroidota bacterium]